MGKIHILPPDLINQIAAGEVVERPSSVVKELVENAIDAGATRIEVLASDGGRSLRVADNGCGMEKDDLLVAFKNHATSKVKQIDDLFHIQTLGFRGEALASIAAISKLTCTSRPPESATGLKATVQSSGDVSLQEAGCAVGTIFDVKDLFYNVPARLKFLKRPQTELAHIQETLQMLALSHPEIAFELRIEGAHSLKTTGSGDLEKTFTELFSLSESDTFVSFEMQDTEFGYRVRGQSTTPNVMRGSRKWMMTFVNGRAVKCPILMKAIETAYTGMLTPGKFPMTVLFLELPPDEVDVNVHPTKKEVKYQRANTLFSFVRCALENALAQSLTPKYSFNTPLETSASITIASIPTGRAPSASPTTPSPFSPSHDGASRFMSRPDPAQVEIASTPDYHKAALSFYAPHAAESEEASGLPQRQNYTVVGQLSRTYILVETHDGLLVVDQHIASERVRFETLSEQAEHAEAVSQKLLLPLRFPASPLQQELLREHQSTLDQLGFVYHLTEAGVEFTHVPSLYSDKIVRTSIDAMLLHLEETGEIQLSMTDVIATAACHSAVRAGDFLNQEQMERIIDQWYQCKRPWTCPHGRPVSHLISKSQLMAFFDRPSLPIGQ